MVRHIRRALQACMVTLIIFGAILFVYYTPHYHINNSKTSRRAWFYRNESATLDTSERISYLRLKPTGYKLVKDQSSSYKAAEENESLPSNSSTNNQRGNGSLSKIRKFIGKFIGNASENDTGSRGQRTGQRQEPNTGVRVKQSLGLKRPNYCPLWPQELVGPLPNDSFTQPFQLSADIRRALEPGGRYRPRGCDPREKVAVIIPYRDRQGHLKIQLNHLHTVLQRQNLQYGIFVVEMAFPTPFNRGLLANVGFLAASDVMTYTCYVIHDVDLLVMDDRNLYRCGRVPRHLLSHSTKYDKLPYLSYFGGVVALSARHFRAVNGFSNLYFGWGGEDDDLLSRIFHANLHISRPKPLIGGFWALKHPLDSGNPVNPRRDILLKSVKERMAQDGINSAQYTLLALEKRPLYTWVYIAVNETNITRNYQQFFER